MKHLTYTLVFLTAMFFTACDDSPITPIGGEGEKPGIEASNFGLVEVTISGIGTDNMTAHALPARSNMAFSLTKPSGSGAGDGTIQMEAVSNGSFTFGIRGSGGVRYLYATFKVRNANVNGPPYPTPRQNLTFLAVDTDATAGAPETYGVTPISQMRLFDGTVLTGSTAATIAEATIPTGLADLGSSGDIVTSYPDVLQVFTEAAVLAIPTIPILQGVTVFPYGFITRSPEVTPGSREVTTSAPDLFNGLVTFAFKLPLQSQANQDPFEITALFMPVDDSEERITQSLEEQNVEGRRQLLSRVNALSPDAVTLFPGSTYRGEGQVQCNPVRVAGTDVSPTVELSAPLPGFTALSPNPPATTGFIQPGTSFTATFAGPVTVSQPLERYLVIHGRQSGTQFIGGVYTGNGTGSIATPSNSFFPGEIVEVSRIRGFGGCSGTVARYRVRTAGTLTFSSQVTFAVENNPRSISMGDVNGDGDLDMVVGNSDDNNVSVFLSDGLVIAEVPGSPFDAGLGPLSVALGDVDGDGVLDMVTANGLDKLSVFLGDGSGKFTEAAGSPFTVGDSPHSVALGDVNGDGALDMAAANLISNDLTVLLGDGVGGFREAGGSPYAVGGSPTSVALGDMDGDGTLDMAAANGSGGTVSVLLGDGTGGFSETSASPFAVGDIPRSVALGDVNGDGVLDMVTANSEDAHASVLLGDGAGGFSEAVGSPFIVGNEPYSVVLGDVNGDFKLDIVAARLFDDKVSVLLGDGAGGFTPMAGSPFTAGDEPYDVALGDLSGDGVLDMVVVNSDESSVSVFYGQ